MSARGGAGTVPAPPSPDRRSEEHTSELQSQSNLVCRLLLEKKNNRPWRAARIGPGKEFDRALNARVGAPRCVDAPQARKAAKRSRAPGFLPRLPPCATLLAA